MKKIMHKLNGLAVEALDFEFEADVENVDTSNEDKLYTSAVYSVSQQRLVMGKPFTGKVAQSTILLGKKVAKVNHPEKVYFRPDTKELKKLLDVEKFDENVIFVKHNDKCSIMLPNLVWMNEMFMIIEE